MIYIYIVQRIIGEMEVEKEQASRFTVYVELGLLTNDQANTKEDLKPRWYIYPVAFNCIISWRCLLLFDRMG